MSERNFKTNIMLNKNVQGLIMTHHRDSRKPVDSCSLCNASSRAKTCIRKQCGSLCAVRVFLTQLCAGCVHAANDGRVKERQEGQGKAVEGSRKGGGRSKRRRWKGQGEGGGRSRKGGGRSRKRWWKVKERAVEGQGKGGGRSRKRQWKDEERRQGRSSRRCSRPRERQVHEDLGRHRRCCLRRRLAPQLFRQRLQQQSQQPR